MATKKPGSKTAAKKNVKKDFDKTKNAVKAEVNAVANEKAKTPAKAASTSAEAKKTKISVKKAVAPAPKKAVKKTDKTKTAAVKTAVKENKTTAKKKTVSSATKEKSIFKAIATADLASFKALLPTQKNKRGEFERTPLMVISLILSNPGMTDGSNYETRRVTNGKAVYVEMYRLLIDAKCDTNAMDIAGNTARDYRYGGFLNQMLTD